MLFIALPLSVLGPIVQASTGANGAELMFFYYTYQMEFPTKGEGNTNIATTYEGSGGNPCTLIEFLKTIIIPKHKAFQYALSFLTPERRTTIDTTSPDMKTSSETLYLQLELLVGNIGATKARAWFFGAYDGTKFFKGCTEIDLIKNKPIGEVFADTTNTLQEVTIEDGRVYLELDIPQSLQVSGLAPDSP